MILEQIVFMTLVWATIQCVNQLGEVLGEKTEPFEVKSLLVYLPFLIFIQSPYTEFESQLICICLALSWMIWYSGIYIFDERIQQVIAAILVGFLFLASVTLKFL